MFAIRKAKVEELQNIREFYDCLIDEMAGMPYQPTWIKGVYPATASLEAAIQKGELLVGEENGQLAAAVILNNSGNEGYQNIAWPVKAQAHEVRVIHSLGVRPGFAGKGYGKRMVQEVVDTAKKAGCKALRLDVRGENLPAKNLYCAMGFSLVATVELYYEDTGLREFELFERPL